MRFQVPQFIEIEDKIFGPFTFKQFVYLAGGAGLCLVLFTFLPKFIAILLSVPIAIFSLALVFYKPNDKPFINTVEAFFKYTLTSKLYIWKKESKNPEPSTKNLEPGPVEQVYVPKLSDSKLKDLSWSLDIKESQNPVTNDEGTNV
jgi:hypothetical protein